MTSDQYIPRHADIAAHALDCRESAARLHDEATARQLDRLVANLPGAVLCWQLGTLVVTSPSGNTYHVTRAGCDCPNGKARQHSCWHWALMGVVLDIFETEVVTRDNEAEAAPWYTRVSAARSACWARM